MLFQEGMYGVRDIMNQVSQDKDMVGILLADES